MRKRAVKTKSLLKKMTLAADTIIKYSLNKFSLHFRHNQFFQQTLAKPNRMYWSASPKLLFKEINTSSKIDFSSRPLSSAATPTPA